MEALELNTQGSRPLDEQYFLTLLVAVLDHPHAKEDFLRIRHMRMGLDYFSHKTGTTNFSIDWRIEFENGLTLLIKNYSTPGRAGGRNEFCLSVRKPYSNGFSITNITPDKIYHFTKHAIERLEERWHKGDLVDKELDAYLAFDVVPRQPRNGFPCRNGNGGTPAIATKSGVFLAKKESSDNLSIYSFQTLVSYHELEPPQRDFLHKVDKFNFFNPANTTKFQLATTPNRISESVLEGGNQYFECLAQIGRKLDSD